MLIKLQKPKVQIFKLRMENAFNFGVLKIKGNTYLRVRTIKEFNPSFELEALIS